MFNFKYKKHDYIFNNLVKLSRNIFFYKDIKLDDKLENRVTLIFAHLSIIIKNLNKKKEYKNISQEIYDNIFHNLENNLRELGHGDVTVNKKMKLFNRMFHDILIKFIDEKTPLGTAGSLKFLSNEFKQPFIVSNCDTIVSINYSSLYEFHQTENH